MKELEYNFKRIIDVNFESVGIESDELKKKIVLELSIEVQKIQRKNLQNLLEFCKIVEKEEKGLLFIRKMIINLIE